MQTNLSPALIATERGREADRILRSCVHCGFCNATCPTYQLLADENDGPRGRIYLIKEVLEGAAPTDITRTHLDRCLTCRACETTCPSGVEYGKLLDIGRDLVADAVPHRGVEGVARRLMRAVVPFPNRLGPLLRLAQRLRRLLPRTLRNKIPARQRTMLWPPPRHARKFLLLEGCVQSVATPATNAALAIWLDRQGISAIAASGCCGALAHHTNAAEEAEATMRENVARWRGQLAAHDAEGIISTASGCGTQVKQYGYLLATDEAREVTGVVQDAAELVLELVQSGVARIDAVGRGRRVAWHAPCTLQHGQRVRGTVETLLTTAGYTLVPVSDSHLCCGSAGSHSLLQPAIANGLRARKLRALEAGEPEIIATANVGCELHLAGASGVPVKHWLSLLAP